jgi:hypothetical protein
MTDNNHPLSTLVGQGWEVVSFSTSHNGTSNKEMSAILLRRGRSHKILRMRPKYFGSGRVVTEEDI